LDKFGDNCGGNMANTVFTNYIVDVEIRQMTDNRHSKILKAHPEPAQVSLKKRKREKKERENSCQKRIIIVSDKGTKSIHYLITIVYVDNYSCLVKFKYHNDFQSMEVV
jgi:hypothetical protein